MFIQENLIRKKLRSLGLHIFKRIENIGNANFSTNGEEVFIHNLFRSFNTLNSDNDQITIFDIGANVGNYTNMLLKRNKQYAKNLTIYCFEPTKAAYEELKRKHGNKSNIYIEKTAISNQNGETEIFYDEEKSGFASLYKRNLGAFSIYLNKSERVETIRLDSFIKEKQTEHIHFLKIDIEGHELKAFEGMGDYLHYEFIDFIQFEYGGANLDSHTSLMEFYDLFTRRKFTIAKIMPSGLLIRDYEYFMDNFIYANFVAISNKVLNRIR